MSPNLPYISVPTAAVGLSNSDQDLLTRLVKEWAGRHPRNALRGA